MVVPQLKVRSSASHTESVVVISGCRSSGDRVGRSCGSQTTCLYPHIERIGDTVPVVLRSPWNIDAF